MSATQSSVALQPAPNVSPFGALPAMPPLSIGHPGSIPSIQYGISSMLLGYGSTAVELLTSKSPLLSIIDLYQNAQVLKKTWTYSTKHGKNEKRKPV
ncbi:unnamed protein product [Camellia sinensis]